MRTKRKFNYDFAVICYPITSLAREDYVKYIYEKVYRDKKGYSIVITKERAKALIDDHKLELVIDNEYGKIYDRKERV